MQRFRNTAHARESAQQQQQQQQQQAAAAAAAAAAADVAVVPPRPPALSYSAALFKSLDTHAAAAAAAANPAHAVPHPAAATAADDASSAAPPPLPPRDRTPSKGSALGSAACVTPPSPTVEYSSSLLHTSDSVGEGCFDSHSHVSSSDSPSHGGSKSSSARSTPRASVSLQSESYSASSLSPATAAVVAREAKMAGEADAAHDEPSRKGPSSVHRGSIIKADKSAANKDHVAPPITDAQVFPTLGGVAPVVAAPAIKGAWGKAPPVVRAASISAVPSSSSASSACSSSSSRTTPSARTPLCGSTPVQKAAAPSAATQAALHEEAMMLSANAVPAATSGRATPKQEELKLESATLAISVPKEANEEKQLSPNVLRPSSAAAAAVLKPKKGAPVLCLQLPASSAAAMSPPASSDGSLTSSGHSANSAREGSSKPQKTHRKDKARRSKMVEALAALSMDGLRAGANMHSDEPGSGAASAGSSSSRTRSPAGVKSVLSLASSSESAGATVPNTPHSLGCTPGATTPSTPTLMSAHQHQQNQQQQASRSKLEQTRNKLQQRRAQTLRPSPSSHSFPSGPSVSIPGSGTSSPRISTRHVHNPSSSSSGGGSLPKSASARNFSHMSNATYRNERSSGDRGSSSLSHNSPHHSAQSTPTHSQYYSQQGYAQPHFFQPTTTGQPQLISLMPHAPNGVMPASAFAMQQAQQAAAAAAVSGYRVHTPTVHSQPTSSAPSPRVTPATPRLETIKLQLEYYFSDENLARDVYLRSLMNRRGYVPIGKLLEFNRLRAITTRSLDVLTAAKASQYLKLKNGAIRCRGETWRKFAPATPATATGTEPAAQDADVTDEENEEVRLANLVHTPSASSIASSAAAAAAAAAAAMPTDSPTPSLFSSSSEGSNESVAGLGQPLVAPMTPLMYAAPPMPLPVLPSYAAPYVYPLSYFPVGAAAGASPYAFIPVFSSAPVPSTPPLYTISLPSGSNHAGALPYPTPIPIQMPVQQTQLQQQQPQQHQSPQLHSRQKQPRKKHEGSKPSTPAAPADAPVAAAAAVAADAQTQPVRKHSLNHYASAPAAFAPTAEAAQASAMDADTAAAATAESKQPEQNGH